MSERADQSDQSDSAGELHHPEHFMQIGEVAQRTGLTQRALRYYESLGLLAPASRMDGGFRLYSELDVARLDRIVELKRLLGFSLAEIRQIMEADDLLRQIRTENKLHPDPEGRRAGLRRAVDIIKEQLALIHSRMEAMRQLQEHYERRLDRIRGRLANLEGNSSKSGLHSEHEQRATIRS
jgi:MerR family transcriptional regulator, repressor of the yfmOP operon